MFSFPAETKGLPSLPSGKNKKKMLVDNKEPTSMAFRLDLPWMEKITE